MNKRYTNREDPDTEANDPMHKKIKVSKETSIPVEPEKQTLELFLLEKVKKHNLFNESDQELLKLFFGNRTELEKTRFLKLLKNARREQQISENGCQDHQEKEDVAMNVESSEEDHYGHQIGTNHAPTDSSKEMNGSFQIGDSVFPIRLVLCIDSTKKQKLTSIPSLEEGLKNFMKHFVTFAKQGRLLLEKKCLLVKDKTMGPNSQDVILDPLAPYQILPSYIDLVFEASNQYETMHIEEEELKDILSKISDVEQQFRIEVVETNSPLIIETAKDRDTTDEDDDDLIFARFRKLIHFFNNTPIPHFTHEDINNCRDNLKRTCVGFTYYADKIHQELVGTLTSSVYDLPKGILFYGPPGTGKTYCSTKVLKHLKIWMIHPYLAAVDFIKPYVGQSEQMLKKIADRCDILPWELCALFVDEIDEICPNRKGDNISLRMIDMLSVFLSIMDGNKRKKNLMFVGTSNRLEYIDKAFFHRMDIKLFIGLPNIESKADWIDRMVDKWESSIPITNAIKELIKGMKKELLPYTLNFTPHAMQRALCQIMTNAIEQSKTWDVEDIEKIRRALFRLAYEILNQICLNDKIYISSYTSPALVEKLKNLDGFATTTIDWKILTKTNQNQQKFTKRMLIDLKEQASEQFQMEVTQIGKIGKKQHDFVQNLTDYLVNSNSMETVEEYLTFYDTFKEVFSFYYNEMDPVLRESLKLPENHECLKTFFQQFRYGGILDRLLRDDQNNSIHTFGLVQSEILASRDDALIILLKMAVQAKFNFILVLDMSYFLRCGRMTDEEIAEEIFRVVQEATQYESCLVIFDLDSIAGLTKEYTGLLPDLITSSGLAFANEKNDSQFSYSIYKKMAFRVALQSLRMTPNQERNHWFVGISNSAKLTLDFKVKAQWPSTKEQKRIENQIWLKNITQACKKSFRLSEKKIMTQINVPSISLILVIDEDYANNLKTPNQGNSGYNPHEDPRMRYIQEEVVYEEIRKKDPDAKN